MRSNSMNMLLALVLFPVVLIGLAYVLPLRDIDWGSVSLKPASTVTVSGFASEQQNNQIAEFSAGVNAVSNDKQAAIDEVNTKTDALIQAVKEFGVSEQDIKTQNLSVNQEEKLVYEEGSQVYRPGQWRANNTISVKLKEIDKASDLYKILTDSGATNVYGPNFMVDSQTENEGELLKAAIEDARKKAEAAALGSGNKLGDILSVAEGGAQTGIPLMSARMEGGGGGAPVMPGSSEVSKSVTVSFELR